MLAYVSPSPWGQRPQNWAKGPEYRAKGPETGPKAQFGGLQLPHRPRLCWLKASINQVLYIYMLLP